MNSSFNFTYLKKIEHLLKDHLSLSFKNYAIIFFNNKNYILESSNPNDIGKKQFFNRNTFRSSTEHAEMRALKRIKNRDRRKCLLFSLRVNKGNDDCINFSKSTPCINCYKSLCKSREGTNVKNVFFMEPERGENIIFKICDSEENERNERNQNIVIIIVIIRYSSGERNIMRNKKNL